MYRILEHPDITRALRTGYPRYEEEEVLDEEEDEEEDTEIWGDELLDDLFQERKERELFGY